MFVPVCFTIGVEIMKKETEQNVEESVQATNATPSTANDEKKPSFFNRLFRKKALLETEAEEKFLNVEHFDVNEKEGLSLDQVDERISQGLVNATTKKYF